MDKVRIILRGAEQHRRAMAVLAKTKVDTAKPLAMVIEPYEEDHTRAQQKLYRACIGDAAAEIGYSPDELHDLLLAKHFGQKTLTMGDTTITRPNRRTTTNEDGQRDPLKRGAMSRYYTWAMAYLATEFGIGAV